MTHPQQQLECDDSELIHYAKAAVARGGQQTPTIVVKWLAQAFIRLTKEAALSAGAVPQQEGYAFFVDDKPYTTTHRTLTAMEIKHVAGVPLDERLGHDIGRRFHEGEPLFLSDDTPIDLSGEPKRFYSVPHAYASGTGR
jgi:hypothetical protein